jgi:hypothetical protein
MEIDHSEQCQGSLATLAYAGWASLYPTFTPVLIPSERAGAC